jgi:hypothetical protein
MTAEKIPVALLPPYHEFFKSFVPIEEDHGLALKTLFTLAVKINADMKWMSYVEMPMSVLIDKVFECDEQAEVAATLAYEKPFYSAHYFKCIKEVLRVPSTSKCLHRTLDRTLEFLQLQKQPDYLVSPEILLQCAGL